MSASLCLSIQVHQNDNVAVIVHDGGLDVGCQLVDGTILLEHIPQGHKVAIRQIPLDQPVIRYGEIIGYATTTIAPGAWVKEADLRMPEPPALADLPIATRTSTPAAALEGYSFEGYRNRDGSVGTRNVLAITTSVQCVAGVTEYVVQQIRQKLLPHYPNVDDIVGLTHSYGCGVAINAPAAIVPIRTLQNLMRNPNFGDEIMVLGLGCEKLQPDQLLKARSQIREPGSEASTVSILSLQDEQLLGFGGMIEGILALAEQHLQRLNQRRREPCPAAELVVGVQCGGSDALSGLTANPAVGFAADLIVRAGGSVMFSEVTEVRDAIHLLTPRVADQETGQALLREMAWFDEYLHTGRTDRSANTTPGNKRGGLANIVEKAMGSIIKSGSSAIVDVIAPGERIRKKGLTFAATPASDFICGTLQLAAGMNIHVFTTGRGTPYNLPMAPVIKVATNSRLAKQWYDLIDIDAGTIATGESSIEQVGWQIFHKMLDVASGREQTAADRLGIFNDLVLFNPAPVT
ncbi:galactarate dehydratase [Gynuella sunshinyii]|uniref:Galactarate dehydratase n=1 Tax=Gynuella sunshinyii YC6258 TaxID=1445510 RepID=A0A0C5VKG3_9GAMM|nr:galactarate dehydratase [Gynuella sunshinyii]AJQ93893.1 altronate dehydratase [Gynuella sunshinyii YC6258]